MKQKQTRDKIMRELSKKGLKNRDIAYELNVNEAVVSRTLKRLTKKK